MTIRRTAVAARLALVGDRSPNVRAHVRVPALLEDVRRRDGLALDAYWIPTGDAGQDGALTGFDGIWLLPGSPYRSEAGALAAVRAARVGAVPFLGTCGGFQHALLEYARNVCGRTRAGHAENDPDTGDPLIVPLVCSLVGHEGAVHITPGSLAERVLGARRTVERYHCAYGADPAAVEDLDRHGLRFTGHDDDGHVRIAELPSHPFFLVTLFQPELAGDGTRAHAAVRSFAAAVTAHAAQGRGATVR